MPDGLHDRLRQAVSELAGLLAGLERVLPHRPRAGYRPAGASGAPGKPGARLASWNTQAAWCILEVHAGARELEQNLKYQVTGKIRERGGSDANTLLALEAIISLAPAAGEWELRDALRQVERWCWQARLALGQAEPWVQIPRSPGQRAARCPWCGYCTLRMKPLSGQVRCINPACADVNGVQPVGKVEIGLAFGEPLLVWQDDSVGLATEQETEGIPQ